MFKASFLGLFLILLMVPLGIISPDTGGTLAFICLVIMLASVVTGWFEPDD